MKIPTLSLAPPALDDSRLPEHARRPGLRARRARGLRRALAWVAALVVLALVFLSYLSPGMVFTLANQVWNCF